MAVVVRLRTSATNADVKPCAIRKFAPLLLKCKTNPIVSVLLVKHRLDPEATMEQIVERPDLAFRRCLTTSVSSAFAASFLATTPRLVL